VPDSLRLASAQALGRQPADHDGRIQFLGADNFGTQSVGFKRRNASSRLAAAGLDQQMPRRREPLPRAGGDSPMHIEPVLAAVQRNPRLVEASFRRHQHNRLGRDIRRVGEQQINPTSQRGWEWFIEITMEYASRRREVG